MSNRRLIDANTLWRNIHNAGGRDALKGSWADGWDKAIDECIRLVEEAPTIDPESLRPVGKWEYDPVNEVRICTNCGGKVDSGYYPNYCLHCGARME